MKKNIRMLAVLALAAMLLTLMPAVSVAESQMVLTGDFVNFRASYAGGGTVLACLRQGTVVKQLSSQTYNGGWYHVEYNGQKGYIWGQYLKSVSSSSANANTANNTTANKTTTTAKKTTTNDNTAVARNNDTVRGTINKQVNVRATASGSSKVVGTLKTRTTVSVLSRKNGYVYITTSKMSGYVPSSAVTLKNTKTQTAKVKNVPNGNYKVYVGSTGNGTIVTTLKSNSNIVVISQGSKWSYVKVGNLYGYVSKEIYSIDKPST